MFHIYQLNYFWTWWDMIWRHFEKLCIAENWTYSHHREITDRLLKLPTVMPQFPNCKSGKKRKKKNHYIFTREVILKFNMTVINTIQNSLNKEQILSSEHCMVRKTWSHTLNKRNGAHWVLGVLYTGGRNLIITFSNFITCTVFSFSILLKFLL